MLWKEGERQHAARQPDATEPSEVDGPSTRGIHTMIDAVQILWSPAGVTLSALDPLELVDVTDGDRAYSSWYSHGIVALDVSHWGCPALTDRADGSVRLPA